MNRQVKIYDLELEKTLPYFVNHIKCGKHLSKIVCEKINFKNGTFFTILPVSIVLDKLFDFEHGGIIPSTSYGKNSKSKQINTMDRECCEFIAKFLARNDGNWGVVENYMLDSQSPFAKLENVKMSSLNSEVYYFLNNINSEEEIYQTIRKSSVVWHFLAVLTRIKILISDSFTNLMIDEICKEIRFVICGAYDGEGYIFWKKN